MSRAPAPTEPDRLHRFVCQKNAGNITQTKTHNHNGVRCGTQYQRQAIDSSHSHDTSSADRDMSQNDPNLDRGSTDHDREEEHEIKHFSLDRRGECLDVFITFQVSGFISRPYYEEILQQQNREDPNEHLEITAMMIQPATNESSKTTEEGASSSVIEPKPKHGRLQYGRGNLVQQVTRHVDAYLKHQGVSDAMMPRIKDTVPPSLLWIKAIRVSVVRTLSSHNDNHMLDFEQDDISPATIDPGTHNTLKNLWAQRICIEDT
jgi:hypothetical protein